MGGDCHLNDGALDTWKSWRLAVLLSLRDNPASVDGSGAFRQWPTEVFADRTFAVRHLRNNQRNRYVVLSLDYENYAVGLSLIASQFAAPELTGNFSIMSGEHTNRKPR